MQEAEGSGFVMEDADEFELEAMALHVFDNDGKMTDLWMLRCAMQLGLTVLGVMGMCTAAVVAMLAIWPTSGPAMWPCL